MVLTSIIPLYVSIKLSVFYPRKVMQRIALQVMGDDEQSSRKRVRNRKATALEDSDEEVWCMP